MIKFDLIDKDFDLFVGDSSIRLGCVDQGRDKLSCISCFLTKTTTSNCLYYDCFLNWLKERNNQFQRNAFRTRIGKLEFFKVFLANVVSAPPLYLNSMTMLIISDWNRLVMVNKSLRIRKIIKNKSLHNFISPGLTVNDRKIAKDEKRVSPAEAKHLAVRELISNALEGNGISDAEANLIL